MLEGFNVTHFKYFNPTFFNYSKPEHLIKLKASKGMMIMKQAYDSAKNRQHEADVCAPLRDACSALRQKAN